MAALVRASEEMREGFGLSSMEPPDVVRSWFEGLFRRYDFTHQALAYFRTLRLVIAGAEANSPLSASTRCGAASICCLSVAPRD